MDRFARGEVDRVEVTEEATRAFNEQVADAMGPTVWNTGCNSWYLTEDGSVDLWPFDQATMVRMLSEPEDAHFHIRYGREISTAPRRGGRARAAAMPRSRNHG